VSGPTLPIDQGTQRYITVTNLRDAHKQVLNPTGWTITAMARQGSVRGPLVATWRDDPGAGEYLAEVVDADPLIDPTVQPGEKWVYLHVDPSASNAWTWVTAELWVNLAEPSPGVRSESWQAHLQLNRSSIYT
jgi:hypothetical protein